MNMPVKHINLWISLVIQQILSLIAHNGIMAQNDLSLLIGKLLIRLDPLKPLPVYFSA